MILLLVCTLLIAAASAIEWLMAALPAWPLGALAACCCGAAAFFYRSDR